MEEELGATGRYPYGTIDEHDEGELSFKVGSDRDTETVVVEFGKEVRWIGMRPEHAEALAQTLLKHAQRARR